MRRVLLVILILMFSALDCFPQSMCSLKGLYAIPTAEIPKDGEVAVGAFFLKKEYIGPVLTSHNSLAYFASIAFLPFLEGSVRFTKDMMPGDALGDRMLGVKIQAHKESNHLPSIAFGIQDFLYIYGSEGTIRFHSTYILCSKNFMLASDVNLKATTGYGFKAVRAQGYQFIGLFGGVSIEFFRTVELIGEYDGFDLNSAVRLDLFDHVRLLGGLVKGKHFSGGASFYFGL